MGFFRRNKKKNKNKKAEEELKHRAVVVNDRKSPRSRVQRPTSPVEEREGPPPRHPMSPRFVRTNDSSEFQPSEVHSKMTEDDEWALTTRTSAPLPKRTGYSTAPPPAREAAFGGPPRFDWIDIVSQNSL